MYHPTTVENPRPLSSMRSVQNGIAVSGKVTVKHGIHGLSPMAYPILQEKAEMMQLGLVILVFLIGVMLMLHLRSPFPLD
jgi:hypothetical protein